ncbi:hypothetical protein GCM10009648_07710 [Tsukamurella spumae]
MVHVANTTNRSPVPASEGGPGIVVLADDLVVPAPRVGLVVSKAVGDSVTRHAVARKLRAAAASVTADLDDGALVVVRALRASVDDDANELAAQLRSGLTKLGAL